VRFQRLFLSAFALVGVSNFSIAQDNTLLPATQLVPESTQGFVRFTNLPQFLNRWDKTQIGVLAELPSMQAFWEDQQNEIEKRFRDAGWEINLHPNDIKEIATGQVAIAWIAMPTEIKKPYSVVLIVDIAGKEAQTQQVLERVEEELKNRKATIEHQKFLEQTITHAVLPRQQGELKIEESFYVVSKGQLFAADDIKAIEFVLSQQSGKAQPSLEDSKNYTTSVGRLEGKVTSTDFEYFVNPIGFANVLRSISHKPSTRQTDILKVLTNQGFDRISAVTGKVQLATDQLDVQHECFVLAPKPWPEAVKILDFPNIADVNVPKWVGKNSASFLSTAWNASEAFWKVEGIVDEIAGESGTFDIVIEGIQTDPKGPQIDIRNDILPFMTNEIFAINDCIEPITPDSRRSLIAIRITNNEKMSKVLDRIMKDEPDATPMDFEQHRIWVVSHEEDADLANIGLDEDLESFDAEPEGDNQEEEEQPWLNNWAIAVHDNYLMFSSHPEMITDAIKADFKTSPLGDEADFARAKAKVVELSNGNPNCFWNVDRADLSFKMQYELFRQDKLPQSRSMLASILDRIIRPKKDVKDEVQRVKGDRLPPFETIRQHLLPGGTVIQTQDDGWSIQSFVLGLNKEATNDGLSQSSLNTAQGTDNQAADADASNRPKR
jgi:hypothetical protein